MSAIGISIVLALCLRRLSLDNKAILSVENLTKHYKDFSLNKVSFDVERGKITGFIGNNGAGKTTTLRCILGLSPYPGGSIKIKGNTLRENEYRYKSSLGVAFDFGGFYENFTLEQMKNVISASYKNWDDSIFHEYLAKFSLNKDKKVGELSKGMKIKYSLALALSHDAQIIILDEPTSGLDPRSRDVLCKELLYQKECGKTILFSTHITSDLDKVADNIVLIDEGKVLYSGKKNQFTADCDEDIEAAMFRRIKIRSR